MHERFELVMPLDRLSGCLFCGTQLLCEVEEVPWMIWWPTKYTFILAYMGLDGHGAISKPIIVFSLFYLLQYLNSNCVFSQKDILKSMHECFELVMPLDPNYYLK